MYGLCRHVCYSGELLLRSVQPRDYPSVPSGLPTVASLEREGPSLPYPGLVDTSNSSVFPLSARFEKGIVCSSRLPLFWVAWRWYCPWVHWVIIPLSFVFFLRPLCFPFWLPVQRGDNSGSFSCHSVMFAFPGCPHYCSILLLCPYCIHLGWYLTSLHSFILTGF